MTNNPSNSFQIGTVLNNKWVILEFIAKGGMGEVYRAHQLNLKRDVAIKVVSREWLEGLDEDEEEIETSLRRFRREVEAMARVRHSNILQIFDYDSIWVKEDKKDVPIEYIVMEYIPGSTLRSTMSNEGFYPEEDLIKSWLIDYFFPVLDGVGAMHELDMVHRDLKPENVLMDERTPKIADFGLIRSRKWEPVTQSIHVMGTAAYMAPEQFMDFKGTDQRADIYALGKILFEAIEGKMSSSTIPLKSASLANPETPFFYKLDRIIQKATAEDKSDRYQSIKELQNALLQAVGVDGRKPGKIQKSELPFTGGEVPPLSRPKWFWPRIAIACISAGLLGILLWHFLGDAGKITSSVKETQVILEHAQTGPHVDSGQNSRSAVETKLSLKPEDGVTLHRINGGKVTLPYNFGSDSNKSIKVDSFYMDENQVTNHQYVDFLNQVLSKIHVEKNTVRSRAEIWLLLGEVMKGYEPIVFRGGKFHIKKPAHASCPVLRVTGYGASAYARFYGKRLPSAVEWFYTAEKGGWSDEKYTGSTSEVGENADRDEMMNHMMGHMMGSKVKDRKQVPTQVQRGLSSMPEPVILSKPNKFGIRGLNGSISEWGLKLRTENRTEKTEEAGYLILGQFGSTTTKGNKVISFIFRQPWEAFEEVGFRCVISAKAFKNRNP